MALDSPNEIFEYESEVSDCGSTVVEPPTSPSRALKGGLSHKYVSSTRSLASTPSPAPRSLTPDAVPDPPANTPGCHSTPEDKATRKFPSTPNRVLASENEPPNKNPDPEDEAYFTLPPLRPVPDQQASPTMPEFPSQPFLFDFEIPHLTASPEELASTRKRSRDEFEADLGTILDTEIFGDQGLGIWVPEEAGGVQHYSIPLDGDVQVSLGAPTAPETECPGGMDEGGEEEKREAKSPRVGPCKRRKV